MKSLFLPLILAISLLTPFKNFFHSTPVDRVSNSIFRITMINSQQETAYCTGFMVGPKEVLTAAHCIGTSVRADGAVTETLKVDQYYDLALLKVDQSIRPIVTFRYTPVVVGEQLTGIGYGFGWSRLLQMKEIVSIVAYPITTGTPVGIIVQGGYIGGMSGGPVVDNDGNVVGIIQQSNQSIGYGVGSEIIKTFLDDRLK